MTIQLPADLERSIRQAVRGGRFASEDDAMAEAARLLLRRIQEEPGPTAATVPAMENADEAARRRPIWDEVDELAAAVPDEEWNKLPTDGAEQHDHYLYGAPKRPSSP